VPNSRGSASSPGAASGLMKHRLPFFASFYKPKTAAGTQL